MNPLSIASTKATIKRISKRLKRATLARWGLEHGVPLIIYALLSIALTWPTVQHFTTSLTGSGDDVQHYLWQLWHVKEAVFGKQPLFYARLLYHPLGAPLLTHGTGPIMGLFALPFWAWGPEAAYNGALLIDFWLTGYFMYLLARTLKFERGVAVFAGILLLTSEMHLAGILGHKEKTFLGFLPLALLTMHHAFNPRRSRWWAVAAAFMLLLTLLYSGWQFILAVVAVGFFSLAAWFATEPNRRYLLLRRGVLLAISISVLVGPLLIAIVSAARNPAITVSNNLESVIWQPDLIEFLLPSRYSWLYGPRVTRWLWSHGMNWSIETTISLARTGIFLCLLTLASKHRLARHWLMFTLLFMLFALGPTLKVFGRTHFTEYELPIILPYAFLTALPGLDFMRTSGRFMLMGFVGFGIAASFGLAWLTRHFARWRHFITAVAIILVLIESWPQPWPQIKLRPVPQFYQQIAQDEGVYGVFDLPIKPSSHYWEIGYSSHYQMYQMTHGKGIAAGYLSRTYERHPVFPCLFSLEPTQPDVLVNGEPANCYVNAQFKLARQGYRYVVWHKPQEEYPEYKPGSWGEEKARELIDAAFGQAAPLVDDELVQVYAVDPSRNTARPTMTIELGDNWYGIDSGGRWAASPATLAVASPRRQRASLQITLSTMHDPQSLGGAGTEGVLRIQAGDSFSTSVDIATHRTTTVPIVLQPGFQTITLTLQAGNFRPADYGRPDSRLLSFSIRSMNLQTR